MRSITPGIYYNPRPDCTALPWPGRALQMVANEHLEDELRHNSSDRDRLMNRGYFKTQQLQEKSGVRCSGDADISICTTFVFELIRPVPARKHARPLRQAVVELQP